MDPITSQVATSAIAVMIMQWLKESKLVSFIDHNSAWTNRLVASLLALLGSLGIGYMWDPTAGILTITGLQVSHVWNTLWAWFVSYGTQWLIYKMAIRKGEPGELPLAVNKAPANVVVPTDVKVVEQK